MTLAGICALSAQTTGTITGKTADKNTGFPIEFSSVSLHETATGGFKGGCLTDSLGVFRFENVPEGTYHVTCSYAGCDPAVSDIFKVRKGITTDIGVLSLPAGTQLDEVVVEGRKRAFAVQLDRKVFNAGEDLASTAGSAADLMQHIPSVDVDMDGNVSLRGNKDVTILINGKASAMTGGRTLGDALNQLPAGDIERIEVMTNPSAEYKPDGTSGIINIILKEDGARGVNGTVNANTGSHGRANTGISLNYGTRGMNIFGGYYWRKDRYDRSVSDRRVSQDDITEQSTYGIGQPISHTARLGMNVSLSGNDRLEASGSYNSRRFNRNEHIVSETRNVSGALTDSYRRERKAYARENMWDASVRYSHTYGKGNEIGAAYAYSYESEDEINHYTTLHTGTQTDNDETVWDANRVHAATLFWNHRLSENVKLTTGYELEHLKTEQNYHSFDIHGGRLVPDMSRTNDFTHLRLINSLHATTEMQYGRWHILAGLRGEHADIRNDLHSGGVASRRHYLNIYPTAHISYPLMNASEVSLSYSMRVNRPAGHDMNPFAERINPLSLEAGNPDLKPEKAHSLEAGWLWHANKGYSLAATLYYRYITDKITDVSRYIEDGILLTTKENLRSSRYAGMELICALPICNPLYVDLDLEGYYNQIATDKTGGDKTRNAFSWSALVNANIRPFRHYMVQLNARYRSATLVPRGKRDADVRVNLGMRYEIPAINLAITASVTDLFDTYRKAYTLTTPELTQKVEKRRNPRIIYIGLSWQFGGRRHSNNTKLEYDEDL